MAIGFKLNSHSAEFKQALEDAKERILTQWGLLAESYAKKACPVDTGNLRNSISNDHDEDATYVGTNVGYAPYVELGTSRTRAKPFLKPAITDHSSKYRQVAINELKNS